MQLDTCRLHTSADADAPVHESVALPERTPRHMLVSARSLPDDALLEAVRSLAGRERQITAELVAHLGEIDVRELYKREGYGSLFVYCRDALGLSEHEAYGRIEAARAARKFPLVLELLRNGAITFTAVGLLARHLTPENHDAVLRSAQGKKKFEVEEIVTALQPSPDVPATLRRLSARTTSASPAPSPAVTPPVLPEAADDVPASAPDHADPLGRQPGRSSQVSAGNAPANPQTLFRAAASAGPAALPPSPLAADRYRYQLTIDGETRELLAAAKDMLRHVDPRGDDAALLKRALRLLVADLARKRFAAIPKPKSAGPTPTPKAPGSSATGCATSRAAAGDSRHIPARVRRAVFERDGRRCAFVSGTGHRCGERGFLEFHHVRPYAIGGEASERNIELRCRSHNQYESRLYFQRDDSNEGTSSLARTSGP